MKVIIEISREEKESLHDISDLPSWLESLIENSYSYNHYTDECFELEVTVKEINQ